MSDTEKDPKDPSTTSFAYDVMAPQWDKLETLLGGTLAMRTAGNKYLPKHAEESDPAYEERLQAAVLLNVADLTLSTWVGKPFGDPVHISEDMPEDIQVLLEDVDLQGNNIDVFARNVFKEGLAKAFTHVMVDFPRTQQEGQEGGPRTLADDRSQGVRPYWVHVRPEQVLFAHAEVIDGREVLTHVRILEEIIEMDGFAEVSKQQIRVLEPGLVQIYQEVKTKTKKKQWALVEKYTYDLPFIPFITFYADREGFMLGKPPLADLADLNITHWQSTSDQRVILTVSRFPMLAVSGVDDDEQKAMRVGPYEWLATQDAQGRFYYVEHEGAAIEAGRKDLRDLEDQMAHYGADFMRKRSQPSTATERVLDTTEVTSPLQDVTNRFIDAMNQMLQMTGAWLKRSDIGSLNLNTEFSFQGPQGEDIVALREARRDRDISRQAYLDELVRRGVLNDDFDLEADALLIEQEMLAFSGSSEDLDEEEEEENK